MFYMPVAIIILNRAVRDFSRVETKNTKMAEDRISRCCLGFFLTHKDTSCIHTCIT